jgi:transposase
MLRAVVHPASVQDRDGAARLLDHRTRRRFPFIEVVFADQGYQGPQAAGAAARTGSWTLEIVRRAPGQHGFAVLPKRWIVERTFAWLGRCRRLSKDYEGRPETTEAWIRVAMIHPMPKRLAPR